MYKTIQINDFRLFQNQTLLFGKYLTVLSGRNSTGKSTILGMIANSGELKKKDGLTYFSKPFRAEFSEIFKSSKQFDCTGSNRFVITLCDDNGTEIDSRSFRTAWQAKGNTVQEKRFRVIPYKKLDDGKKTEAKLEYPILYLGLSRLFPIGESQDSSISTKTISFNPEEHKNWFVENYKRILSMQTDVQSVTNFSIGETDRKSGIGISADRYDYLTNSSGQDNLGQILLALLSFIALKEKQGNSWRGGVLLIDEIDATLHPVAQNKLLSLLLQEAKNNNFQVVVTTHSLSFLRDVCEKTKYNDYDDSINNNVELYYLTNANRKLEIKRNPSFIEIENDLMIKSVIQNSFKTKLYSEDAEARWFLEHLVQDFLVYVDVLETTIGCDQLINLYNADLQYFGNALVVLDGDVKKEQLGKIPERIRDNYKNILKLPGEESPEKMLHNYLLSLDSDHEFWFSNHARKAGFTWDYFCENGPNSYEREKEREKYKEWFKEHRLLFESTHLMDFWKEDNSEAVEKFRKEFRDAYNHIAKRTMCAQIEEPIK